MRTLKTFTTRHGAKVTTAANKDYIVIGEVTRVTPRAVVMLRTDNLETAITRQRREIHRLDTPFAFIYVFRKADGAARSEATGEWSVPVQHLTEL